MTIDIPLWALSALVVTASGVVLSVIAFAAALMSSNDYIDRLAKMTAEEFEQWKRSYRTFGKTTMDDVKEGENECRK
jgi:hypothetical protein